MKTNAQRIEETCGYPAGFGVLSDFFFKHLVLPKGKQVFQLPVLSAMAIEHQVDFISKEEHGTISFLHVTDVENLDAILELGLQPNVEGYVGDLGWGVYLIEEDDDTACDNLYDFLEAREPDSEVLILKGSYTGNYTRCLYGQGHEGYIVAKETVLAESIEDWYTKTVEEIEFEGFNQ